MKKRLIAQKTVSISADDFRAAMAARRDAEAAVLFFLAGAKKDRAMYQGRTAREAFDAACRLLDIDETARAKIEEALA